MGSFALVDVTTYIGGYDMTTDMNQISLNLSADEKDSTTFGNGGWRSRVGSHKDISGELAGYWGAGTPSVDAEAFANLGVADRVITMTPTGVEASTAYLWRGEKFGYELFGGIGDVTPFSLSLQGSHGQGMARGTLLKARGNVSATGATGSAVQITGGVPTGLALHGSFHVFTAGTTVTAVVESDDNSGFTTPTTRLTFGPLTSSQGVISRLAGPITDTWFRLRVSAITGTFNVACAIGIGV